MRKPKHTGGNPKQKHSPSDWDGLSNEPRNENLFGIRGPTLFEKNENDRDKERGPKFLYRFNKQEGGGPRD